ncbi:LLM class flavin-dependent oxidoreductase [Nisaea acidiphila]|uniref:LLM class flavin-dependent oxidoreductase n=1 Tax=Nisaea acidiphila TaxID=1862145 RepID=A0A9J7AT67_9PROT|nr:LLM class flavin-dependent oxidoreductase [Nisaea acidiphila]UUX49681.1 LLM class flavin-dependent oxidoreductase [Nisaea acidiphila]
MAKLGLFMMPLHPPARDFHTVLQENRELVKLADRLGYAEAWMGEHYTSTAEPVTSPLLFNASLIDETENIIFGSGVISLPQQHPVVVAGHAALFDHLARGRFIFGIGSGGLSSDWEIFGNLDHKARAMAMVESIDLIQKVWSEDPPWSHEGEHFTASISDRVLPEYGIGRFIKPYQQPHPPIAVSVRGANSMTAHFAGQRGWCLLSGNFVPAADIATHWPTYAGGAEKAGRRADPNVWRVGRSVLITESDAEAEEICRDPDGVFAWYFRYLGAQGQLAAGTKPEEIYWDAVQAEAMGKVRDFVIAGSAGTVLDKLVAFRDEIGDFGTLMLTAHDMEGVKEMWLRSFTRMAEEVWPKLKGYMEGKRAPHATRGAAE